MRLVSELSWSPWNWSARLLWCAVVCVTVFRLLTLWFDYGQWPDVYEALTEGIKSIQIDNWLQVSSTHVGMCTAVGGGQLRVGVSAGCQSQLWVCVSSGCVCQLCVCEHWVCVTSWVCVSSRCVSAPGVFHLLGGCHCQLWVGICVTCYFVCNSASFLSVFVPVLFIWLQVQMSVTELAHLNCVTGCHCRETSCGCQMLKALLMCCRWYPSWLLASTRLAVWWVDWFISCWWTLARHTLRSALAACHSLLPCFLSLSLCTLRSALAARHSLLPCFLSLSLCTLRSAWLHATAYCPAFSLSLCAPSGQHGCMPLPTALLSLSLSVHPQVSMAACHSLLPCFLSLSLCTLRSAWLHATPYCPAFSLSLCAPSGQHGCTPLPTALLSLSLSVHPQVSMAACHSLLPCFLSLSLCTLRSAWLHATPYCPAFSLSLCAPSGQHGCMPLPTALLSLSLSVHPQVSMAACHSLLPCFLSLSLCTLRSAWLHATPYCPAFSLSLCAPSGQHGCTPLPTALLSLSLSLSLSVHPQVSTGCTPLPNSLLLSAPSWSDLPTGRGRGEKEREGEGEGEEGWEEEGGVERMFDPVWSWTQLSCFKKKKLTLYICFVLLLSVLVFNTSNCRHPASSKLCVCVHVCVHVCANVHLCACMCL